MQADLQAVGGRVAFGVLHQPFGTTCIGILGQPADGQLGLLTLRARQITQQGAGRLGQQVHMGTEFGQGHGLQADLGFGHGINRMRQAQQAG